MSTPGSSIFLFLLRRHHHCCSVQSRSPQLLFSLASSFYHSQSLPSRPACALLRQSAVTRSIAHTSRASRHRFYSTAADFSASQGPTRRSLPSRFLRTVGLALVFIPIGFVMATVPAVPAINELLTPPSDAETVQLFQPYDDRSAEINEHILNHPVAQALRQNAAFTESRPFMKIPPAVQQHHLTSGVLGGAGKLWVPPLAFNEEGGKSQVVLLYLGQDICGHPGIVHGGMLATLLDEGLARCCFAALPHKVGMTASLTLNYKAPTPADTFVALRATTTKVDGRKAWVEGRIEQLDPPEGKEPVVYATAEALFIEPKQAATMQRLYPVASG